MNRKSPLLYGILGALIGGGIVWFATTTTLQQTQFGMMGNRSSTISGTNQTGRGMMGNIDRRFIEQMIPHHQDAITMADLALRKAEHQEIKKLAENIKKSQSEEITNMQNWYQEWYGIPVPETTRQGTSGMGMMNTMHGGIMGNQTDIGDLENVDNFDKTFIEEMIPHHQMAVMMANMLLSGTNRPEMEQLAKDIITAQTKEITDMRQWYTQWEY